MKFKDQKEINKNDQEKEKKESITSQAYQEEKRRNNWHYRNRKKNQRIQWTVIRQQIGQSRRNGQILRNIQLPWLRNSLNRLITRYKIESVIIIIKKSSNKSPRPDGFTEEFISILLKLYQKNSRGITPKFIPQGHYYLDIKTRWRYHKK